MSPHKLSHYANLPANPVVAVAGVTGAVGREMLLALEQRSFPAARVKALASARSVGKRLDFNGPGAEGTYENGQGYLVVEEMRPESFADVDIALFSAGSALSKEYRPFVREAKAVMIDNSSAFRMDTDVPLVVPEVNPADVWLHQGVIANPNCSTIQLVMVLNVLSRLAPIKRVVCSTYQAASGAGAAAMDELYEQTRQFLAGEQLTIQNFLHQIAFNCIPQIDVFMDDGSTKEEWKMVVETRKILHESDLALAMSCVRVPVLRCHAESVHVEFASAVNVAAARELLAGAAGVSVIDDPAAQNYPMPGLLAGTDDVYVGRLRRDPSVTHGLAFWSVADQLRKGAALNAVQIAELLLAS
ncbi:MAG: aspartate-semialdehyde dehydrogenase [Coriobacteriales bacterium]|jgi:aspartate-semialdehyde dehydrogenase|nr:aspartate-semialdehyde dehydrogenase [Coriobacteriales bacterium]